MAKKQNSKPKMNIMWMYILIFASIFALWMMRNDASFTTRQMQWSQFKDAVNANAVDNIVIYSDKKAEADVVSDSLRRVLTKDDPKPTPADGNAVGANDKLRIAVEIPSTDAADKLIGKAQEEGRYTGDYKYEDNSGLSNILWYFGPVVLLVLLWVLMFRRMGGAGGGGIFNVGKSKAALFDGSNGDKVTFNDVAGLAEAKVEIAEIVDFLKNPETYTELGGKIPKGALLVGPPGTGKTLLAKAVAGEAEVPFFSLSGSDFVEMFVGVGASRVRDLFSQAKSKAPCIIFIDEIDAVGRARGKNPSLGGNDERESTLNQLLTEMDGFGSNSGIIVLAATNRADILDKALLRAGRFDRQIYVELPELTDRKEIFQVHLRGVKTDGSVDLDFLARQTPGFSGADIANVCNEAALIAARRKKQAVQRQDFTDAIDRIVGGLEKRSKVITADERHSIAVHEAGHATVGWHLEFADPLIKVTIVPRGKALGAAWYAPEERQIEPRQAILDQICKLLAGRAAEELFIGFTDTGALNDLERSTKLAYAMVTYYGMSDTLPNISYYDSSSDSYGFTKPYSEERARAIDAEVQKIINGEYERAKALLKRYETGHHELADLLERREVIFAEDAERIFGPRQWRSRNDIIAEQESPDGDEPADDNTTVTPPPFQP